MVKYIYSTNIMSLSFTVDDIKYKCVISVASMSYNQYTMDVLMDTVDKSDDIDDYYNHKDGTCVNIHYCDRDWTIEPIYCDINNLEYTINISNYVTQPNYNSFDCMVQIKKTDTNKIILENTSKCFVPIDKELGNKPSTVISDNIHKLLDEINEFEPIEETSYTSFYTSSDAFKYILEEALDYTNLHTNLKKKLIDTCYDLKNSKSEDHYVDYKKLVRKCDKILTKLGEPLRRSERIRNLPPVNYNE